MTVVVFGSINVDIVTRVDSLPRPGETVTSTGMAALPGGKGSNQAIASALFGAPTRMIGAVGDDPYADTAIAALERARVDARGVARVSGPTGMAHVCVSRDGENQIVIVPGANATMRADDLWAGGDGDICLVQLELPLDAVGSILAQARRAGSRTILNAAPALDAARSLLSSADILIVNETELALYLRAPPPRSPDGAVLAARTLLSGPMQWIIVTLGAAGIVAVSAGSSILIPAPKVAVVDTTGAGDTFCGVLAGALADGATMDGALRFACAAAALSVQREGASPSMPDRAEIEAAMAAVDGRAP
jgi:ribokinase